MSQQQQQQQLHPLSPENIEQCASICGDFIRTTCNVNLETATLHQILSNIHKKNFEYFRSHPPMPSLQDLNKRAMTEVRDFVLQKIKAQQLPLPQQQPHQQKPVAPPTPPIQSLPLQKQLDQLQEQQLYDRQKLDTTFQQYEQTQTQAQQKQPQSQNMNMNIMSNDIIDKFQSEFAPLVPEASQSIREEKNEDDFFKKLQVLELQRGAHINLQQPTSDPITGSIEANQSKIQAAPPQSTNTIIYMSNKGATDARNTKPIVLCGASRMWVHIVDRNLLVFKGPLPDSMHVRLTRLLLPKRVGRNTPCVNVHIKSAVDKTMDVLCVLDKEGPTWDIWKPISSTLSLIKTFACPWTLSLNDTFGNPLDMGKDGQKILSVTTLMNGNTKLTLDSDTDIKEFAQILIQRQDGIEKHYNTIHVIQNTVEIPGDTAKADITINESYVCNLQAQAYIVLEMEQDSDPQIDGEDEGYREGDS